MITFVAKQTGSTGCGSC